MYKLILLCCFYYNNLDSYLSYILIITIFQRFNNKSQCKHTVKILYKLEYQDYEFTGKAITKRQSYILPNLNIKTVLRKILLFNPGDFKWANNRVWSVIPNHLPSPSKLPKCQKCNYTAVPSLTNHTYIYIVYVHTYILPA